MDKFKTQEEKYTIERTCLLGPLKVVSDLSSFSCTSMNIATVTSKIPTEFVDGVQVAETTF